MCTEATSTTSQPAAPRPVVHLVGQVDGNAFSIIGACVRAARKAKWTEAQIDALKADMMAGDHDHLWSVMFSHFDVD